MAMAWKRKEELKLTTYQTERLIEFYQAEEGLWNATLPIYTKKEDRKKALRRIICQMQEQFYGFYCTEEQLQGKLSNLRGYYSKELAKINRSKKKGADEVYTSQWTHSTALDVFLRAQIAPRAYKSTDEINGGVNLDDLVDDMVESTDTNVFDTSPTLPKKVCLRDTDPVTTNTSMNCFQSPPEGRTKDITSNTTMNCGTDRPKVRIRDTSNRPPQKNDETAFGMYIANELSRIPDQRTRAFIKYRMQCILFETQYGEMGLFDTGPPS